MVVLNAILIGLLLVLLVWLLRLRVQLRETTEAIRERQVWLRDEVTIGSRWMGLLDLQNVANELLKKYKEQGKTQRGYLEQIRTTLGSIREAVFIIDGDNQIVLANEALWELLKLEEDPVGRRLQSVVQGADFLDYVRGVKAGAQSGFFVLEVEVGRESCWFEITGARLPESGEGLQKLILFVLHDITKQTRLERMRTEFVQNLSHELRTPVTVIKGFADALKEDFETLGVEERGQFLEKIQKNSVRLNTMLEELLMLSRLENNPAALQFSPTSFHKVLQETAETFRMRLGKGQELLVDLAPGDDTLLLDPMRMAQVLENLFENALRHAGELTVLSIKTEISPEGLTCRVRDNGQGIPEKDLPHLFERFYRVDKGRSRGSGGTGLGLSIAKHIVQQHGGRISAESVVGKGTEMVIEVPSKDVLAEEGDGSLGFKASAAASARKQVRSPS